jgi:hypothetical protein
MHGNPADASRQHTFHELFESNKGFPKSAGLVKNTIPGRAGEFDPQDF